jgi:monoamine oxidase
VRWRTAKADVHGHVPELLAQAIDQGAPDAELTAEDRERPVEFLEDFGRLSDASTYKGGDRPRVFRP